MPRSTDDKKPPVQQGRAETVKQEPQKQQGAPQGQQEASQGAETLSGEIAKVTPGKNGVIVLAVNGQVVVVPAKHASDDFVVGAKLLCSVVKVTIKGQHCLEVRGVEMLVHPVQEGEIVDAEFADVEPKGEDPVLQEARDNGLSGLFEEKAPEQKPQTTMEAPARDTGEATKPGTIGVKRAKRLYAIIGQNRKNTGFGETEMKHILAALPTPLEHLRDLEIGLYEEFEKMATGESDWKQFLDD
jgi:hypothetical protein